MSWAPDYITPSQLKEYTRISDDLDNTQVALACTAASRAVDGACGRQFGKVSASTTWLFTARWDNSRRRWFVPIEDLSSGSGMVVEVDGVAVTSYTLLPTRAVDKGKVFTELVFGESVSVSSDIDAISITSDKWGWSSVPSVAEMASLLQGSRFMARRDSPYGIAGSPDTGSELRLLSRLDPDVRMMLMAAGLARLVTA